MLGKARFKERGEWKSTRRRAATNGDTIMPTKTATKLRGELVYVLDFATSKSHRSVGMPIRRSRRSLWDDSVEDKNELLKTNKVPAFEWILRRCNKTSDDFSCKGITGFSLHIWFVAAKSSSIVGHAFGCFGSTRRGTRIPIQTAEDLYFVLGVLMNEPASDQPDMIPTPSFIGQAPPPKFLWLGACHAKRGAIG
ncbi:MAG: hypothetical protein JWR19_2761 [Pedosphaera sp.]|nr:hypothetical protein [Pedosphaera sp.]